MSSVPQSKQANESGQLSRLETLRALRIWLVEGCVATVQITLTGGAFQTGFALLLGCNSFLLGVLAAIPSGVGLLQLGAAYLSDRFSSRKVIVTSFALISRLAWIPILLIPFLLPRALWVGTFLIIILIASVFGTLSSPLWTAWISDLVPADNRGRYFGAKNMYGGVTGMVVSVVAGWFLDHMTKTQHWPPLDAFAVLFVIGSVFAIGSFALGRASPDVPIVKTDTDRPTFQMLLVSYKAPFQDDAFRRLIAYFVVIAIAQSIAGQFFVAYPLTYLHLDYTVLQLLNSIASVASLLTMPLWGYLADKYGNKPILTIATFFILAAPFLWCLTEPDSYRGFYSVTGHGHLVVSSSKIWIAVLNLCSGAGWAGVGLTQFNMMIGSSTPQSRAVTIATISAVVGVVSGVSPLLGGALMQTLAGVHFPAHGLVRNNYHVLFLLSAALRLVALWCATLLLEPASRSAGYVLGQIRAAKPLGAFSALQRLSRGGTSDHRRRAVADLGRLKTPVAVEELVRALDDVSLLVREEAATALGEIGDARAVPPLVSKLGDPASGIAGEAAKALGKIGDKDALPALAAAAQLEGPLPRRIAAIEALGQIPDERILPLLLSFAEETDPSLRLAAIRALLSQEAFARRADVAATLLKLWEHETDPTLLAALADALSHTERPDYAQALLSVYDRIASPVFRREVLNAVASLIAGRDSFYAYLRLDAFARDETITKVLQTLQRQLAGRQSHLRAVVRLRQALESYTKGDYSESLHHLYQTVELLSNAADQLTGSEASRATRGVLEALDQRTRDGRGATGEEVLLAVFLTRHFISLQAREK